MQTWARRGVQAALVTGGVLAVGSGVSTAGETRTDQPTTPLGELPPDFGTGGYGWHGTRFTGELFTGETGGRHGEPAGGPSAPPRRSSAEPRAVLDEEPTEEIPVLREQHWLDPQPKHAKREPVAQVRSLHLAGWVADIQPGRHAADAPALGTPAEGFHRSLSWSGPIGEVVTAGRPAKSPAHRGAPRQEGLLAPEPGFTGFTGFAGAEEPAGERKSASGGAQPLLLAEDVDLTSAEVPSLRSKLIPVPDEALRAALREISREFPENKTDPLEIPGEHHLAVTELPELPVPLGLVREASGTGPPMEAFGDARTSRIATALLGTESTTVDSLVPAPPRQQPRPPGADRPARSAPPRPQPAPIRRTAGGPLPLATDALPPLDALEEQTRPLPRVPASELLANADTVVFERI